MQLMRQLMIPVAACLLASAAPIAAQPPTLTALSERPVVIRSGPGAHFAPVGLLEEGEQVELTARSGPGSNWLRVHLPRREGWLAHYTVTVEGDPADLRVAAPRDPRPLPQVTGQVWAYAFRTVNVRAEPKMNSDILCQLTSGDVIRVIGRSTRENDWLYVDLDGIFGWVAYFTVTLTGDLRGLDIIDPATGEPVTSVNVTELGPVWAQAFRTVNVRQGPGVAHAIFGQLSSGDHVRVLGRSDARNNWLQIDYEGQPGWVAYFTVSLNGDLSALAIIPPPD